MNCEKCKELMKKVGSMVSGNATYETYMCRGCLVERMVCVGVNG